jgi:hypothetical protein
LNGDLIPLNRVTSLKIDIEDVEIVSGRTRDEFPVLGVIRSRPALPTKGRQNHDR